jgi:hypothetical protein
MAQIIAAPRWRPSLVLPRSPAPADQQRHSSRWIVQRRRDLFCAVLAAVFLAARMERRHAAALAR